MFSMMLVGALGAQDATKRATAIKFKKQRTALFRLGFLIKYVFGDLRNLSFPLLLLLIVLADDLS
jgi:hypothetical protein